MVVDAIEAGQSVVVAGEAGVGKTVVMDEAARRLAERGYRVVRCVAIEGLADLPLAAVAHLVPSVAGLDAAAAGRAAAEALTTLAPGSGAVLCVDDAPLLDPLSAHAILQARDAGRLRVLATARGTGELPGAVAPLARGAGLRLDLQRLSRAETGELAAAILGAALDTASVTRLFRATDGLALAVDELVRCAAARDAFVAEAGLWRWRPDAQIDERLAALLGLRFAELAGAERDALALVCTAESLPADVIRAVVGEVDLAAMAERRLLRAGDRPGWVVPGHLLLQDAVRERLEPLRRNELLGRLVTQLHDGVASDDPMLRRRLVAAAVSLDVAVPDDDLLDVVRWARAQNATRHVAPVVARCWAQVPTAFTGLAHGDVLAAAGRHDAACVVFEAAGALAAGDDERVAIALAHASSLRHGLGRLDDGAAVLDRARSLTHDPALLLQVTAVEADDLLLLGRARDVIDLWEAAARHGESTAAHFRMTQPVVAAHAYAGRISDALAVMAVHERWAPVHGDAHPLVREFTGRRWASTAILAGAGDLVRERVVEQYEDAVEASDGFLRLMSSLPLGIDAWLRGDLLRAEHLAREAMGVPVDEVRQIAQYLLVRVLLLMDRTDEVAAWCEEALASAKSSIEINVSWITTAKAQSLAARGRRSDAVEVMLDGAELADRMGQVVPSAYFFHDVFRVEGPRRVAGRLAELAASCDAPVVAVMADHVGAVAAGDDARLVAAAARAHAIGCGTFARAMLDDAVRIARDSGRSADAAAAATQLARVREAQTGWPEPVVADAVDALGLTPRELEVARRAAAGATDAEIAAEFVVSVRTVNAQLRAVYRKLGVDGRRALRSVPGLGG